VAHDRRSLALVLAGERELHGRRRLEPRKLLLPGRRRGAGHREPDAGGGRQAHVVQPRRQPDPGAGPGRGDRQPVGARRRHHPGGQVHLLQRHALEVGRVVTEAADARAGGRHPLERWPARQQRHLRLCLVDGAGALLHNVYLRRLVLGLVLCSFFRGPLLRFLFERRVLVVIHRTPLKTRPLQMLVSQVQYIHPNTETKGPIILP
jgi:hypothetical protein